MSSGIYGIRNDVTGKWYIGQAVNIEVRNRNEKRNIERGYIHPNGSSNYHFNRAIKKYGSDAFSFHIIELCDKSLLDEKEVFYIQAYNSLSPNGYNLTKGGTSGTKGYKFSDEQKKRMSEVQKQMIADGRNKNAFKKGKNNPMFGKPSQLRGKKIPTEIVKKAVANRRSFVGEANPNYGKHASDKTKAIWHEQRAGRKLTDEWKQKISEGSTKSKAVRCIETNETYNSCVEAARKNGVNTPRNIGDVCRGILKTAGGKHWEFVRS